MRERVRQLGGSFKIRSTDKGTVVVTRLPLDKRTNTRSDDLAAPPLFVAPSGLLRPHA
jgi:signal transduction histidine kinase